MRRRVSYFVQARHRRRGEIETFKLVRWDNSKTWDGRGIEPSSFREAEQFVKEWGDHNEFWEYTLIIPESGVQGQFDLEQE